MPWNVVLGWTLTGVLGWLSWRYLHTGVAANRTGRYARIRSPLGYWFAIVIHALLTAIAAGATVAVTLDALGL
jgi:hypothetical protein